MSFESEASKNLDEIGKKIKKLDQYFCEIESDFNLGMVQERNVSLVGAIDALRDFFMAIDWGQLANMEKQIGINNVLREIQKNERGEK